MADAMSRAPETLRPGAPWEKTGNASWSQCGTCANWFPVGAELLALPAVKLHCPHCHAEFLAADAARLIKAG